MKKIEDDFYNFDSSLIDDGFIEDNTQENDVEDIELEDIDFSDFSGGDFKRSLRKVNRAYDKTSKKKPTKKSSVLKSNIAKKKKITNIPVNKRAIMYGKQKGNVEAKTTKRIIVPRTQEVIIEGVDKFILANKGAENVKNIGYCNGKKLKELILVLDNSNSLIDFNLELFNPSMPLDYLYSTSGNLNGKIQTANSDMSYTDVLYNLLGNPANILNCKFVFSGNQVASQISQPLIMKNKEINSEEKIEPIQLSLQIDNMQVANDIVFFDMFSKINRPFIPNGMDVIQYKVLAGNICTFCFYYEQKDLRRFFYESARNSKKLL
jgi:hypothetical protein